MLQLIHSYLQYADLQYIFLKRFCLYIIYSPKQPDDVTIIRTYKHIYSSYKHI